MTRYMTKYPSLFTDSVAITKLRRTAQRPLGTEDFYSTYMFRPFTIYCSKYIVQNTNVSANSITLGMAIISYLLPILVYNSSTPLTCFIMATLGFLFVLLLDVLDGEVARLRDTTSKIGELIDASLWYSLGALLVVVQLKLNQYYIKCNLLVPVIMIVWGLLCYSRHCLQEYKNFSQAEVNKDGTARMSYLNIFLERPSHYLGISVVVYLSNILNCESVIQYWTILILLLISQVYVISKRLKTVFSSLSEG